MRVPVVGTEDEKSQISCVNDDFTYGSKLNGRSDRDENEAIAWAEYRLQP